MMETGRKLDAKIAVLLLIVLLAGGCTKISSYDHISRMVSLLNNLESYYAVVKMEIQDDEESRMYRYRQWVRLPSHYRLEVIEPKSIEGKVTASSGKKTWMTHPRIKEVVELEFPEVYQNVPLFIGDFLSKYWDSEKASAKETTIDGKPCVILSYPSVGRNPSYALEKIIMDVKEKRPLYITVYDQQGKEVVKVTFEEFRPVSHLEDNLFEVPESPAEG